MKPTLIATSSIVAMGVAAAGLAGPARAADPNALGTYTVTVAEQLTGTWVATPCVDDTEHCIHVTNSGIGKQQPWEADAFWSVGSWIMFVDEPDAIGCDDGTTHPGKMTYSWDAAKMAGYASIFNNGICGGKPATLYAPFTLTKLGGAEVPPPAA